MKRKHSYQRSKRPQKMILLFVLLIFFSACKTTQPKRISFIVPESKSEKNWPGIFAHPRDITVTTVTTGEIKVKSSDVLNLKNPNAKGMKDSSFYVPVFVHVIHHPLYGDWLIDTGLDSSFYSDPHGNIKGMFRNKFSCVQKKGQDIASQLAAMGITPKGVFFTHLHADHIAGVSALPKNVKYVCGKGEVPIIIRPLGIRLFSSEQLSELEKIEEFDFSNSLSITPLGPVIDVFGDGSLLAVSTTGHTVSHVSYIINCSTGPVLLTGDVSHTKIGFDRNIEPGGFTLDKPQNLKSLLQLKELVKMYPQMKVIYGHQLR